MMEFTNHIKSVVAGMLSQRGTARWGLVTSVDPSGPTARVLLQPEGIETGSLPIKCMAAGAVSVVCLPLNGDMVLVHPDMGDGEHGIIDGAAHNTVTPPPVMPITGKPPQQNEYVINLPGGAYLHFTGGTWYFKGNIVVEGNMTLSGTVTAQNFINLDGTEFNGHVHGGVNSGSDNTASPVAGS